MALTPLFKQSQELAGHGRGSLFEMACAIASIRFTHIPYVHNIL
ncbi:hypothetical protein [Nostoc sp. JL33]|nr:hypothetical protein [Nostoc sp. JL33]